ncbi:MAG TPA: hypothetical protein VFQ39_16155, partial [Longimicrobium sp.]|nr:hypothetical protein [Longimicrobium sp.]
HNYERFAPQDPEGRADPRGVRQFVVGTGGAPAYPMRHARETTEARTNRARGVLRLVFHDDGYEWDFVPIRGVSYSDRGRAECSPPVPNPRFTVGAAETPAGLRREAAEDAKEEREEE